MKNIINRFFSMKRSLSKIKINMKTFITITSFSSVIIILVFIGALTYSGSLSVMRSNLEVINKGELIQMNKKFEFKMNELKKVCQILSINKELFDNIDIYKKNALESNIYENYQIANQIESTLYQMKLHNNSIEAIVVLTENAVFSTGINFYNLTFKEIKDSTKVYNALLLNGLTPTLFDLDASILPNTIVDDVHISLNVLFSKPTYGSLLIQDGNEYGCIFVIAKDSLLNDNLKSKSGLVLLNSSSGFAWSNGMIIGNDTSYSFNAIMNENAGEVSIKQKGVSTEGFYVNSSINSWKILYINNLEDFKNQLHKLRNLLMSFLLLSLLFTIPLSKLLLNNTFRILKKLLQKLRQYKMHEDSHDFNIDIGKHSNISFREKMMYYYFAIIILPIFLFTSLYYFSTTRIMEDEVEKSLQTNFTYMKQNLEFLLSQQKNITESIVFDRNIQNYIMGLSSPEEAGKIQELINDKMKIGQIYISIDIFNTEGELEISNNASKSVLTNNSLFETIKASDGEMLWQGPTLDEYNRMLVNMYMKIKNFSSGIRSAGYAKIGFDENYLEQVYRESLSKGIEIYIEDEDGRIISHIDKQLVGSFKNNGVTESSAESSSNTSYLTMSQKLAGSPWNLVVKYNYDIIHNASKGIIYSTIYIITIVVLLSIILLWYLSNIFTRPLNRLRMMIASTGNSSLVEYNQENYFFSEIHELVKAYNDMTARIDNLIDEVLISKMARRELEGQKKELELIALQAQINPHFLCNTLESIKWIIIGKDTEKAAKMIETLNNLFRFGISRMESIITIEQEVAYAKSYTEIIKFRYNMKINFIWDIDSSLLGYKTIKLILQPLIENSIYHGLESKPSGGSIIIRCQDDSHQILFSIIDDGIGLQPDKLEDLRNKLEERNSLNIGLINVHSRIKLYFGKAYGLKIDSTPGKGTIVSINLPKIL